MTYNYKRMNTKIGPLHILATDKYLVAVIFENGWKDFSKKIEFVQKNNKILDKTIEQLKEYFSGKRKEFDLPLNFEGTEFQKKTWNALLTIPYGETISYSEQAKRIDRPKAIRCVGTTNGKNPISIIAPCHRVIGKNGSLTGYGGGLDIKQKLLDLERKQNI